MHLTIQVAEGDSTTFFHRGSVALLHRFKKLLQEPGIWIQLGAYQR